MKKLVDSNTRVILINNPSNPCGSVFSKKHMLEIIDFANTYRLPIIADEVYYGLVYDEQAEFHAFGDLTQEVPIIVSLKIP